MGCTVCKHTFVHVAKLLQMLKGEELIPEVQEKARSVAAMVTVTGYHIIDQELEKELERKI